MSNPIISFLIIILSLGFGFLYVKPEYEITQQRQSEIKTLDTTLNSTSQIQALIDQTDKTLSGIDPAELSRFSIFLPESVDAIGLANNIQHMALSRGIVLTEIKVGDPTNSPNVGGQGSEGIQGVVSGVQASVQAQPYATTKTSFKFSTNNDNFHAFLGDMEKSLGIMNITALDITPISESTDSSAKTSRARASGAPQYQYQIDIETYSLK